MDMNGTAPRPRIVVAIPVRNEAERIGACLRALAAQTGLRDGEMGLVLLLNNCRDGTAAAVASLRPEIGVPIRAIEREFAGANAGWARREAMEAAAAWLEDGGDGSGAILTTDADSRVPPDWVARNLAALAAGADAVAGRIALDDADAARLPGALHARGRRESAYESILIQLESAIDPLAHDPWPRHWTTSGASLAVRLDAYRRVGGMPPLALGEDKAFVSSLLSSDARVRHDPAVVVTTSGRLLGRAPGGAADTMRRRCEEPESPCDLRLEPIGRALFRYGWKRRLRRLHASGALARSEGWAPFLGIGPEAARAIAVLPAFGAVFAAVEDASPRLIYRPLRPAALGVNTRGARAALLLVRGALALRGALRTPGPRGAPGRAPAPAERM